MSANAFRKLQGSVDYLISQLSLLAKGQFVMSQELDGLRTQVENATSVMDSAATLIGGLAAQIAELKDDPVALQALADSLSAESGELAAAVQANTPAPVPGPGPAPEPTEPAPEPAPEEPTEPNP